MAGKLTFSGGTKVPSSMRGLVLGGGSLPSFTQSVNATHRARMVSACGFGFVCCSQSPNAGPLTGLKAAEPCCVLAMMYERVFFASGRSTLFRSDPLTHQTDGILRRQR